MNVFSMPEVHIGKEAFDCGVLCVDRHSGYVVVVAARKRGLLAKEVAVMRDGPTDPCVYISRMAHGAGAGPKAMHKTARHHNTVSKLVGHAANQRLHALAKGGQGAERL